MKTIRNTLPALALLIAALWLLLPAAGHSTGPSGAADAFTAESGAFFLRRAEAATQAEKMTAPRNGAPGRTANSGVQSRHAGGNAQARPAKSGANPLESDALVRIGHDITGITPSQIAEIEQRLASINNRYGVHAGLTILRSAPQGHNAESLAKSIVNGGHGFEQGPKGSIVLLVLTDSRKYYIATGRNLNKIIPSNENGIGHIKEAILPSLKESNYEWVGLTFASALEEELAYYESEGEPYDPSGGFSIMAALIALVLSILSAIGIRSYLIGQLSNVHFAPAADAYLERDTFQLTGEEDTYLYTNVTVVDHSSKDSDNDSGGGGSDSYSDDSGSTGGGGGSY